MLCVVSKWLFQLFDYDDAKFKQTHEQTSRKHFDKPCTKNRIVKIFYDEEKAQRVVFNPNYRFFSSSFWICSRFVLHIE